MKRNIFKALAVMTALVLSSCSMFNTVKKDDSDTANKEAYITISLNQTGRTALPTISNANDFDCISLGKKSTTDVNDTGILCGYWKTDEEGTAYSKMSAAKIAIKAGQTYLFTLNAEKGGAKWTDTVTKTIETGENSLSFELELDSFKKAGEGSLSITLGVPSVVKAVDAELKTINETQTFSPTDAALSFKDNKATYTASGIAAGSYVLVFTLWGDEEKTLKLGEWREYAGITKEVTSSSNPVIKSAEELENIYTITLDTNGGTINGTFPGSYTRYGNPIKLPYNAIQCDESGKLIILDDESQIEIYRKNYLFEGWFDAATGGNKIEEISANMLGQVSNGSSNEIKLYARWTDTFTVAVDDMITQKNVDGFGDCLSESLKCFQQKGFDSINLKLTDMKDSKTIDWDVIEDEDFDFIEYIDSRFTAILNAICDVQGDITIDKDENGDREFTYSGLGIKLDLSETNLTYLPPSSFADLALASSLFDDEEEGDDEEEAVSYKMPVNLIGITLPETLTALLPGTFVAPGFTELTIPKNVIYILDVFAALTNGQGLTITFESGSKITHINLITGEGDIYKINIPASVTEIKESAFSYGPLVEIIFDEGSQLKTIGKEAFYGCEFTSITLPATLTTIGDRAFHCNYLETIKFEGTKEQWAAVTRGKDWHEKVPAATITCTDGIVPLDYGVLSNITLPTGGNGTVTSNASNGKATYGTEVTLTIEPETGYALASISATAGNETVTLNGTGNTRTFTMPASDVTITATWSTVSSITVTIADNSTIGITKEDDIDKITLTAEDGFDTNSYYWLIDGWWSGVYEWASLSEDGTVLTIQKADLIAEDAYQISLSATKYGIPYGAQISVKKSAISPK